MIEKEPINIQAEEEITEPKIHLNIFFGSHANKKDADKLEEPLKRAQIYIPEYAAIIEESKQVYQQISDGLISIDDISRLPKVNFNEFHKQELKLLAGTHKIIVFVDIPYDHDLTNKLMFSLQDFFETQRSSQSFEETMTNWREVVKEFSLLQKEREEVILKQLKEQLRNITQTHSELKNKKELEVLMFIGAAHTRIFHQIKNESDLETTREFGERSFSIQQELIRRFIFGKEVSELDLARSLLEPVSFEIIKERLPSKFDQDNIAKFSRKIMPLFSLKEIKELWDNNPRELRKKALIRAIADKNIELPESEEEFDKFISN